ncbi:2-dehydropantoate 2-reductase [Actinocatenispora rupis]|uniref:2-dehydropantoate 2-reductase n=1 Tax=Actinocatenispora rupis TaxID=519421 RepID=A0A8J3N7S4_9ACTN|nr:2-dehydropantoate 2-reductase [Actinocatenispora rupis]GID09589.1 putative 2-dehydropantoate 2-reductase [Actinocatenispora rupis]
MGAPTVAVVGGGAVGGFFAGAVHDAGHPVTLCLRTPLDALTVRTGARVAHVPARFVTDPAGERPVDWLLVATRAGDTRGAAGWFAALAGASTTVVLLHNGIDHAERVAPLIGPATLLPALVHVAAERTAPGEVVHRGGNRLVVPAGAAGRALGDLLAGSGVRVEPVTDFRTEAWRTLVGALAAYPITALTGRGLGVLTEPDVAELARGILAEGVAVAAADGAVLHRDEVARTLRIHRRYRPEDGTPMLSDRLAGRPLETDLTTGAVVAAAARHRIPVPLNRALLALLRAAD